MIVLRYKYQLTNFIMSAPSIHYLPSDQGMEIAFIGRSNAGKSSVLNTITNQKKLAKTSKTPGSTKLINLFEVTPGIRLVDCPGYGYATNIPQDMKKKWYGVLWTYLQKRKSIKGLVVIIDIRSNMNDIDHKIIDWAVKVNLPVMVLLNKSDKLAYSVRQVQLNKIRKIVPGVQVATFSALKRLGIAKVQHTLDSWFV